MPTAPFPTDPDRTAIAIAYRNKSLIADAVLPRVTVKKQEFTYLVYPTAEGFYLPNTRVGRKGEVPEIDLTATEVTSKTEDFGLEEGIPQSDIDEAPENQDPVDHSTEMVTDYILLDREKRVATLVFGAANYGASNKITLSGTSQFSDFVNSDPLGVILTGLDACLLRPNQATFGQEVWTKFSQHPAIVKAVNGTSGDSGIARRQAVAELLELDQINVGQSRLNTAKKGQAATLSRVWGKHISLHHTNPLANTDRGFSFGMTAQKGTRQAMNWHDKKIGAFGGTRTRVAESVKELITAADAGYLIIDAVA
mgnify:CR=1 FL=1